MSESVSFHSKMEYSKLKTEHSKKSIVEVCETCDILSKKTIRKNKYDTHEFEHSCGAKMKQKWNRKQMILLYLLDFSLSRYKLLHKNLPFRFKFDLFDKNHVLVLSFFRLLYKNLVFRAIKQFFLLFLVVFSGISGESVETDSLEIFRIKYKW
jgi:hypothetical protein